MRRSQAIEYVKKVYHLTGWDAQMLWHIYWSSILNYHRPNADEFITTITEYFGKADISDILTDGSLVNGYKKHICVYILMMEGRRYG